MINTILNNLFEKWKTEFKCDKCWVYVKTFNDAVQGTTNIYTPKAEDKCCTHVFLEGITIKTNKKVNNEYAQTTLEYCDYNVHLKIAEISDFQTQKGTEFNCDEGIFDKHINPLIECMACDFEIDVCGLIEGGSVVIFNEVSKPYFSKGDFNWAGLDYNVTIRLYN